MERESHVEEAAVNLPPLEDRDSRIGALWDCHSSTFLDWSIFTDAEPGPEYLEACPTKQSDYELHIIERSSDKRNAFHVSAEITLELMAGMLKVGGGASFDKSSAEEFNAEEFLCVYNVLTYLIRTRPAIAELIDPAVKEKIVTGEWKATHYVAEIQLGASVSASMTVSKNLSESLFALKGSFEGAMVITPLPISIGIKLGLGWLDEEGSSSYSKTIAITSMPSLPPLPGGNPKTVSDMFDRIESIDATIRDCPYGSFEGDIVFGVPVSFKLRPLNELFDTAQDPVYPQLDDGFREEFLDAMLTLHDYVGPNYVTSTLYRMYHPLGILFAPPKSTWGPRAPGDGFEYKNPLTQEILTFEAELEEEALKLRDSGVERMQDYKYGKPEATVEYLGEILKEYHANLKLDPQHIDQKMRDFYRRGRSLLHAVHAQDVDGDVAVHFLKSQQEVTDWLNEVRPGLTKLLLTTGGAESTGKLPSSVFPGLFDLSRAGVEGLEIAVAYPNTVPESSLSLNYDVAKETKYSSSEDIEFALQLLLSLLHGQRVRAPSLPSDSNPMRTLLHRLFAQVRLGTALFLNFANFHTSYFAPFQQFGVGRIAICESYVQLLAELAAEEHDNDNGASASPKWNFVLPIQSVESVYDQIQAYVELRGILERFSAPPPHKWVAGYFKSLSNGGPSPAPILLAFRGSNLAAVCLDQLDLRILEAELQAVPKSTTAVSPIDLTVLSYGQMWIQCWNNVQATNGLKMVEYFDAEAGPERHMTPPTSVYSLGSFPLPDDDHLQGLIRAQEVCRVAALNDMLALLTHLTERVLLAYPELESLLVRGAAGSWTLATGWTGYIDQSPAPWAKLVEELEEFVKDSAGAGAGRRRGKSKDDDNALDLDCLLLALEAMTEFFEGGDPSLVETRVKDICGEYVVEIRSEGSEEEGWFTDSDRAEVMASLRGGRYFQTCGLLARHMYNAQLTAFHEQLPFLTEPASGPTAGWDLTRLREMVEWMQQAKRSTTTREDVDSRNSRFSEAQLADIWLSPKWRYVMKHGEQSEALIQVLQAYYSGAGSGSGSGLPRHLPDFLLARICEHLISKDDSKQYDIPSDEYPAPVLRWRTLEEFVPVLQRTTTKRRLPPHFNHNLQESLTASEEFRHEMRGVSALSYWNEAEMRLEEPWDLATIARVLSSLTAAAAGTQRALIEDRIQEIEAGSHASGSSPAAEARPSPRAVHVGIGVRSEFPEWIAVTGGVLAYRGRQELRGSLLRPRLLLKPIIEAKVNAEVEEEQENLNHAHAMSEIVPWLLQQLTLGLATSALDTVGLLQLINYPWRKPASGHALQFPIDRTTLPRQAQQQQEDFFFGRDDVWAALCACVEPELLRMLLCEVSKEGARGSVALPLLCQDITLASEAFVTPLAMYRLPPSTPPSTRTPDPDANHQSQGQNVIIVCIRHYNDLGRALAPGKSTMLNKIFDGAFLSMDPDAIRLGRSITARHGSGFVEFLNLDIDTNTETGHGGHRLTVTVANVHGDALDPRLTPALRWIASMGTPEFAIFWSVDSYAELKAKRKSLLRDVLHDKVGPRRLHNILLDPDRELSAAVGHTNVVDTGKLHSPAMIEAVREIFRNIASKAAIHPSHPWLGHAQEMAPLPPGIRPLNVGLEASEPVERLLAFIERHSTALLRRLLLQAQAQAQKAEATAALRNSVVLNELIELVQAVLEAQPQPGVEAEFSQWRRLTERLLDLWHDSTTAVRARLLSLSENLQGTVAVEIERLSQELDANKLTLELLFSPFSQNTTFQQEYAEYFRLGHQMELRTTPWNDPFTKFSLPWLQNGEGTPARVFAISVIYAQSFPDGDGDTGLKRLLSQLFGGNGFPHFDEFEFGGLRFRCLDLRLLRQSTGTETNNMTTSPCPSPFDVLLVTECCIDPLRVKDDGGSRRAYEDMVTSLLCTSHLTILELAARGSEESSTRLEKLLELPLAAIPQLFIDEDMKIEPQIAIFVENDASDQLLSEKTQTLVDQARKLNHEMILQPTAGYDCEFGPIQDAIYQRRLIQRLGNASDLHNLIFESASGLSLPEMSPAAWLEYGEWIQGRIKQSPLLSHARTGLQNGAIPQSFEPLKDAVEELFWEHEQILGDAIKEDLEAFEASEEEDDYETDTDTEEEDDDDEVSHSTRDGPASLEPVLQQVTRAVRGTLAHCTNSDGPLDGGPCDACRALMLKQEEFMQTASDDGSAPSPSPTSPYVRRLLLEQEINAYADLVRDDLAARYVQACRALEIRVGKSKTLASALRTICDEEPTEEAAWTRFRRLISTLDGVISPIRQIQAELTREKAMCLIDYLPEQLPSLAELEPPHFVCHTAPNLATQGYDSPLLSSGHGRGHGQPRTLSWAQVKWLETGMQDAVRHVVDYEWGSETYRPGMVRSLKARLESGIIRGFEDVWGAGCTLAPDVVRTLYTIQFTLLERRLRGAFEDWRSENSALAELDKKRELFPNIFNAPDFIQ